MAFTKIVNSDTIQITLPSAIGGGNLAAGAAVIVAYDIQAVGAAMTAAGITKYGMSPTDVVNHLTYRRDSAAAIPGVTINVYVDAANGSDINDGSVAVQNGTGIGPLKTIGAVYEKYPSRPMGGCRIIVNLIGPTSGTPQAYVERVIMLDGGDLLTAPYRFRGGFISNGAFQAGMIQYAPTTGPATAALDSTPATVLQLNNASGIATNLRTQLNFTTANPGWTVDDFAGRAWVRITRSGTMRYFELPISRNTSNTLIVDCLGIVGDILATDTVEIVRNAVTLAGPAVADQNNAPGIAIQGSTGASLTHTLFGKDGGSVFERITFAGNTFARGDMCLSLDRCILPTNAVITVDNMTVVNCCLPRGSFVIIITRLSRFITTGSRPDSASVPTKQAATDPNMSLVGFQAALQIGINGNTTSEFIALGSGNMVFAYPVALWQARPRLAGETRLGSLFSVGGPAGYVSFNNGVALVGDTDTSFVTASTLPAIRARIGAQVRIDPAVTSISGKGGVDLQLETGAAIAMGTGSGQFMEAAGYNGNFTRINDGSAAAPTGDGSRIFISYPV